MSGLLSLLLFKTITKQKVFDHFCCLYPLMSSTFGYYWIILQSFRRSKLYCNRHYHDMGLRQVSSFWGRWWVYVYERLACSYCVTDIWYIKGTGHVI